jgi:2-polyprenyl-3-methyl-5-hydroxy-6-metoxy-1,4-benzoquinol methylase
MNGQIHNTRDPEIEYVRCDLCGADTTVPFAGHCPPVSTLEKVVRCIECGLVYTNPRPTPSRLASMYAKYHDIGIAKVERRRESRMQRLKQIKFLRRLWHWYCGQYLGEVLAAASGKVLDVGCGTGDLLEELKNMGCEPYGIEPSADAVRSCLKRGLKVSEGGLDDVDFSENFFNGVVLWNALEHIPSPRQGLAKIRGMLKLGGRVYIFVPNVESYPAKLFGHHWIGWHMPFHFHHFDVATMRRLAHESGLAIVKIRTVTPEYHLGYSLRAWLSPNTSVVARMILASKITNSLAFRLATAPLMRLLDLCLPGKGEFLAVELARL